jgi:hypothetical protein
MRQEVPPDDAVAAMRSQIREHLIAVARRGGTTTYAEAGRLAGLEVHDVEDRARLAGLLRAISTAEHAAGRPMLTAVVLLHGRGRPGRGFFDLARTLGLHTGSDDQAFFAAELERVYREWAVTWEGTAGSPTGATDREPAGPSATEPADLP